MTFLDSLQKLKESGVDVSKTIIFLDSIGMLASEKEKEEYVKMPTKKKKANDACAKKVKSRYKVWPSAYASGAVAKCRKVGAKNWGKKSGRKKK